MNNVVLKVEQFTKCYGKFKAVSNISFEVCKGEIVGFVGKNGAGKSTTIRCITNMLFPTEGTITISGKDSIKDAKSIKERLSYLPSETEFPKGVTSLELFKFNSKFSLESFDKAIELAKYFELDIKKKVQALSLGNRKKVSIILALMKDSDIIIMDEPTSGLDPLMQSKFFNIILERANNGTSIFLSSHNLVEVQKYCNRVLIIREGELIETKIIDHDSKVTQQVVSYTTIDDIIYTYEVDTDINELVAKLSKLKLKTLEIKEKNIADEMFDYYKGDGDV